jgi:peptide/nickel transport system substrate-binding protein
MLHAGSGRARLQVVIALAAILVLTVVVGYVALTATTVMVPQAGGTYTEGVIGSPMMINPLLCQANPVDQDLVALVYSGLTRVDAQGNVVADLAERWEIADDGMVYTFFLRQDAYWHDGAPVTSADVVFTVNTMQNDGFEGMAFLSTMWRTVVVEQLDTYVVRFILREPFAPFLDYTTIGLLPAHILGSVNVSLLSQSTFNAIPVGSGPFRVEDIDSQRIVLARHEQFYGDSPYLERLEFYFYPDAATAVDARARDEVMGIGRVGPQQMLAIQQDEHTKLYSAPLSGYNLVFLNLDRAIFQDRQVRQAMLWALDRQELVDQVLGGQGLVIDSPILPQSWAFNADLTAYTQDLRRARTLLEQAGWYDDDGDGIRERGDLTLEFTLATNSDDPIRVALIELISEQLEAVGIRAVPEVVPWEELVGQQLRLRQFDAVLSGWQSLSPDPDPYPYWHSSQVNENSVNFANYISSEADDLLAEARRTADPDVRWSLYQRFQELFVEDVPSLLLYQPVYTFAVDETVMGVQIAPMASSGERFATLPQWHLAVERMLYADARDQGLITPAVR